MDEAVLEVLRQFNGINNESRNCNLRSVCTHSNVMAMKILKDICITANLILVLKNNLFYLTTIKIKQGLK